MMRPGKNKQTHTHTKNKTRIKCRGRLHSQFEISPKMCFNSGRKLLTSVAVLTDTNTILRGNSPLSRVTDMKSNREELARGNATLWGKIKHLRFCLTVTIFFGCPKTSSPFISETQRNVKCDNPVSFLLIITQTQMRHIGLSGSGRPYNTFEE